MEQIHFDPHTVLDVVVVKRVDVFTEKVQDVEPITKPEDPASSVTYAVMNKGSDSAFGPYKTPETVGRTGQ